MTNGSQTVTGTVNFDAFGNTVGTSGSSSSPYMYAATSGYRSDGDAGLMHVGARYYDVQVGRWTSRDTVLTEHPYLYCEHNPVNRVDPTGRIGEELVLVGIGVLLVFVVGGFTAVAIGVGLMVLAVGLLVAHGTEIVAIAKMTQYGRASLPDPGDEYHAHPGLYPDIQYPPTPRR